MAGCGTRTLGHLQSIFVTPLRLDAAFDSEAECNELITCSFPDIVDESKLDAVALIMDWKERSERSLKRLRKSVVAENLFRLQQPDSISVQEQFQHITKTSVCCILEMHSKRRQRKYKEDQRIFSDCNNLIRFQFKSSSSTSPRRVCVAFWRCIQNVGRGNTRRTLPTFGHGDLKLNGRNIHSFWRRLWSRQICQWWPL